MSEHTKEPWSLNRHGAVIGGPVIEYTNGSAQSQIAMVVGADWMKEGETSSNARRIVACVNACVHVSTEALEAAAPGQMKTSLDRLCAEIERIEQQRDQLIEALQSISDIASEYEPSRDRESRLTEIRGISRYAIEKGKVQS
jgi:hypothetical protein